MTSSLKPVQTIALIALYCLLTARCGDSSAKDAFANFKPLNEINKYIAPYHQASLPQTVIPQSGSPAVYIDFSDGLVQAYSNGTNRDIIKAITNKLVSPDIEWYSLGQSQITKLEYSSNDLYNKVTDPNQYKDIMAPIQQALKQITSSHNDALLITDFEEYTSNGKEQFENYPKQYFIDWLKAGNSITFFYTDYTEKNNKSKIVTGKHLYFTVFTYGEPTPQSMVSQIKAAFKDRITTKVFELNNHSYSLTNDYGGQDNTGIANKAFSNWATYKVNALNEQKQPYEVIGINKPLDKKMDEYIKKIIKNESGLFLHNLYMDASDQTCYKIEKLAVHVYDVSKDYEKFGRCTEAAKHTPTLVKNEKKEDVWDQQSKNDAIIKECYAPNTTQLKDEWRYAPSSLSANEWSEVFSYDADIFKSHLKNEPQKIELRTTFHPNYKLKNIKSPDALLRIDYVIEDASDNTSSANLSDFQWSSATIKDKPQTALAEAIRNTLQEPSVNPKGKIIYSYYIKFQNKP